MTNEADSPERIEREIEHDRDALRRTLTDLQGELSLDGFTRRVSDQLRDHGGEWANSAAHAARANPVALALTGVGLAWLIFGRGYDPTHQSRALSSGSRGGDDWRRPERPYPVRRSGGSIPDSGSTSSWQGTSPTSGSDFGRGHGEGSKHQQGTAGKIGSKVHDLGGRISDTSASIGEGLRQKAHDWRDSVSDTSGSVYERLSAGTDDLGEEARRRVAEARHRALEARDAASRNLRNGRRAVSDSFDTEPLVFGAAAFAVGAGLACLLPRTRQEDELVGSYSDHLFAEAEAVFNEEKAKVEKAVAAGMSEAKSAASDVATAAKKEMTEDRQDSQGGQHDSSRTQSGAPLGTDRIG